MKPPKPHALSAQNVAPGSAGLAAAEGSLHRQLAGGYDLTMPSSIRFGWGRVSEVAEAVRLSGRRAVFVVGRRGFGESSAEAAIADALGRAGIPWEVVARTVGEPTVADVAVATRAIVRGDGPGLVVVGVGGGSAIDLAKAAAALAAQVTPTTCPPDDQAWDAFVVDHLEGVGRQLPIVHPPLPMIAIPTTAGTGAEATRNAVISCPRRRFKKSLRSPLMVPRAVIVDPQLTVSGPSHVVVTSGLDCITQLIEAYVTRAAKPMPRALVRAALPAALAALPRVAATARLRETQGRGLDRGPTGFDPPSVDADERQAREAMSHAALVSGIALANSGLGMAHGVAAAVGIACGASHGAACGVMLPASIRANLEQPQAAADYADLERLLDAGASADDGVAARRFWQRIEQLCESVAAPRRLGELGVKPDMLDWIAENSGGNSMRGNPLEMPPHRLRLVLQELF